jgi:hypothetical protein
MMKTADLAIYCKATANGHPDFGLRRSHPAQSRGKSRIPDGQLLE